MKVEQYRYIYTIKTGIMKRFTLPAVFLLIVPELVSSQHLAAYLDYRDRFMVFDRGETKEVENYKVISFQVGGNCIGYQSYGNDLKVYYKGAVRTLESPPANIP
jgi:hypothetical protein